MSDVTLRVYAPDLTTPVGVLDLPYDISWVDEWTDPGAGQFTIPHDAPALVAAPALLAPGSLVVVRINEVERFGWMIERRQRTRGDVWDPITVTGRGLLSVLDSAVTYPFRGLTAPPTDTRLFAWMGHDYVMRSGWGDPTSLGRYNNPTDPQLAPDPGDPAINEVQRIRLGAEDPPWPWGSTYPSPGGLSGTWRLNFDGRWTAAIAWDANAAAIKSALEALPNIDGVTVTGTDPWDITFDTGNVAGRKLPLLQMEHTDLRHVHYDWHVRRITTGTAAVEGEEVIPGWPDPLAEWFGGFGTRRHYKRRLRVDLRPQAVGPARLFVAGLGEYDVWFDGDHLGSGQPYDLSTWDLILQEFPHKIGLRSDGPIIMTLARMDGDRVGSILYRTYSPAVFGGSPSPDPWYAYGPDDPHGVTDGYLLGVLMDEAQARSALTPLTRDFDDDEDSNGVLWDDDLEIGLAVGDDSILDAAQRLIDRGVYVRLGPDRVLRAYRDRNADRTGTVTVPVTAAHELSGETDDDRRDAFLVRYEDGWLDRHQPTGGIRREAFLSLGTVPTPGLAFALAGRFLSKLLRSAIVSPFRTNSAQTLSLPYADYNPGDRIVGPLLSAPGGDPLLGDWTTGTVQVDAVAAEVDLTGDIGWVTEVTLP